MEARIDIDVGEIVCEIDPRIYGHFIENMARCIYGGLLRNRRPGSVLGPWELREELIPMVVDMKPPVVRWPGGLYADGYDWRDGIGPLQGRPLRRNRYWSRYGPATRVLDPNVFGTDEFLEFAETIQAEAYVNVNLGTGTPEQAASWVEYVNGDDKGTLEGARRSSCGRKEPWGVKLWGIGNEIYGFWALGHSGPLEYAERYLEFRDAMEEADGGMEYVAVGADSYFSKNWNRALLSRAGDRIDLLSIHIYLPGMERLPEVLLSKARHGSAGFYRAIVSAPLEVERRLRWVKGEIDDVMSGEGGVGVALDEWNLWWKPSQLLGARFRLRDALFVCGVFHAMHRCADFVKMANIAQMVNVLGLIQAFGDRILRSAIYYPFVLYGRNAGGTLVRTDCRCGCFKSPGSGAIPPMEEVPVLDCSATLERDSGTLALFVINRDMEEEVEAEIEIRGMELGGRVRVECLNGPHALSHNWYGRDREVAIRVEDKDPGDVLPVCRFPAHSATALVFGP